MAKGSSKPSNARVVPKIAGYVSIIKPKQGRQTSADSSITKELQQKCLDIFRDALQPSSFDDSTIQELKSHLYHRDFAAAFGKDEYLRVHASRWAPGRTLAYLEILENITIPCLSAREGDVARTKERVYRVVCLGGGAGTELVALAGWFSLMISSSLPFGYDQIHVDLVDSANWTKVVDALFHAVLTPPQLSAYASQSKKDANKALLQPDQISMAFHRLDVLDADAARLQELVGKADLATCMMTLNELYSTSISNTQQLLNNLTAFMPLESLFLDVDSPGSYSTVSVNGSEKKYPVQWLLDYTLRGPSNKHGETTKWQLQETSDSKWFRLPDSSQYPIDLENMRYQMHLYQRASDTGQ